MAGSEGIDPDGGTLLMRSSLEASLTYLPALAEEVEASIAAAGLPLELALQFTLAFDEILTNLASHATQLAGRPVQVEVAIRRYPDRLEATVRDDAPAFDVTSVTPPELDATLEDRDLGGLGLFIVGNVMDDLRYERINAHNQLSMTKHLEASGEPLP